MKSTTKTLLLWSCILIAGLLCSALSAVLFAVILRWALRP